MDTNMLDIDAIVRSAHDGQWLVFAGALLMAIVQIARRVLPNASKKIPKRALPWVVFGIGFLGAGGGVLAGGGGWQAAIIAGVTVGMGALGAYDLAKGTALSFISGGTVTPEEPPAAEPEVKP
jgi:hypothetical protein